MLQEMVVVACSSVCVFLYGAQEFPESPSISRRLSKYIENVAFVARCASVLASNSPLTQFTFQNQVVAGANQSIEPSSAAVLLVLWQTSRRDCGVKPDVRRLSHHPHVCWIPSSDTSSGTVTAPVRQKGFSKRSVEYGSTSGVSEMPQTIVSFSVSFWERCERQFSPPADTAAAEHPP